MRKIEFGILCLVLTFSFCAPGIAEEAEHEDREDLLAEVHEMLEVAMEDTAEEIEPLGKLVRLEFTLVPEDEGDEPLAVYVGTTFYAIAAEMEGEGGEFHIEVEGQLALLEDNLLGITFNVDLGFGDKNGHGRVSAVGSTAVPLGKTGTLAQLGDKTLKVKVTEIDPHAASE